MLHNLINTNNETLNKLSISSQHPISTEIFRLIAETLRKLYSFTFSAQFDHLRGFENYVQCLSDLTNLTEFDMNFCFQSASSLLQSFVSKGIQIQKLVISQATINSDGFESICRMNNLSELKLHLVLGLNLTKNHLVKLAKHLPKLVLIDIQKFSVKLDPNTLKMILSHGGKLEHLCTRVEAGTKINLAEFNTILQIIRSRKKKTYIEIMVFGGTFVVPRHILLENKNWISIKWFNAPYDPYGKLACPNN